MERLSSGWRLLANCPLGAMRIHVVLIRPGAGVALLEVEPTWHPEAVAAFHARLAEAGFAARFPGHLPVIHRRLRPEHLPSLEDILAEAFAWLDPLAVEGEGSWEDEVEWILTPAPVPEKPARTADAEDAPRATPAVAAAPPARRRVGLAASLAIACVAGGAATVILLPRATPPPSAGMPAPAQGAERSLEASLRPAAHPLLTPPSATDAPAAPEDPAALASRGPPPAWVEHPASPPPLPAAITAPQRVVWLPALRPAPPPPGAAMPADAGFWSGSIPRGPAGPAPASPLPAVVQVAALAGTPLPAAAIPLPAADAPPAPHGAPTASAPLPEPGIPPSPPNAPQPVVAAAADRPAAPQETPPLRPAAAATPPMDPALRETMFRRGQSLIAIGDISGARLFLERAAAGGSAAAALALAETYDPGRLARLGVIGLPADPDAALSWYRRALGLGAPEAAARIATLEGSR